MDLDLCPLLSYSPFMDWKLLNNFGELIAQAEPTGYRVGDRLEELEKMKN